MPKLTESELLIKYHELYGLIIQNPRITPREIAKKTKYSGQGKTRATIAYHLRNMYEKEVSFIFKLIKYNRTWYPEISLKEAWSLETPVVLKELPNLEAKEVWNRKRVNL